MKGCEFTPYEKNTYEIQFDSYSLGILNGSINSVNISTPRSWQIMLRVNEARNMLKNGCSLSETALEVGFYDQSHFSKVFKETYGITPKQFTNTMD